MDGKLSVDSKVPLGSAKTSEGVPRQIALSQSDAGNWVKCGRRECAWVEGFAARKLRAIQIEGLTRDDVWPRVRLEAVRETEILIVNVNRGSRSGLDNILDGPAPQQRIRDGLAAVNG